jgi:hypothetical protein
MIKTKTRLGSFYTEFELSRVELRVTRLTREFRVLVPGLMSLDDRACSLAHLEACVCLYLRSGAEPLSHLVC